MNPAKTNQIRQHLSLETGTIYKDWGGKLPIALIYPNSYYIGMSNLGIHAIYSLLNSYPNVVCERAFWEKDKEKPVLSLESRRPLADFALLAFSISYELDYFNIPIILKNSGIPLYAADRDESHPLIIAGGPCITSNPMPVAPFFDCLCIGEAEAIMPNLLSILSEGIKGKRHELLQQLANLPGVYVPSIHPKKLIIRQWARNLDDFPVHSVVLTPDTELSGLYLIEIERGCSWDCRFCLAGQVFRPVRFRSLDSLIAQAEVGLQFRKRLGLVGAAVGDHPQMRELLSKLREMGAEISVSSLRIKHRYPIALSEMAKARTVALAPEAGSQRLRHVIKKDFSEEDILMAIDEVTQPNTNLKLYFMIGLPTETDDDIEAIIDLTLKAKTMLDRKKPGSRITLSIAPFIPKAGTPFQWLPMAELDNINHRLSLLKKSLPPKGINIKEESPAWSEVQAVLSRGDTKLAEVLANVEKISLASWRRAVENCHLDVDYYAHRKWDTDAKLPWSVIDSGTKSEHLKHELDNTLALS